MFKFGFILFILINLCVFLHAFLSDGVKEVHFTKTSDGSDEYDFELPQQSGVPFRGRTFILNNPRTNLYIFFGPDQAIYWVRFSSYEYLHSKSLDKTVRLAVVNGDKMSMRDDFTLFELTISSGELFITPYATKWNLEKICFTKADKKKKTFNYVISSENNSRTLNDTTRYNEANDPHEQQLAVVDFPHCDGVYEVAFTDDELESNETFCKGIKTLISQHVVFGAITVKDVNSKLLKKLTS